MIPSALLFIMAVICYSISQKAQHGQLRWSDPKKPLGFWGEDSDKRKYKPGTKEPAFFLSTTLLVAATDGYHLSQAAFFLLISLSFSVALELDNWKQYLLVYTGAHVIHFVTYKITQR